jgi:hypothetical protein
MELTLSSENGVMVAIASGRASVEEVLRVFKIVIDAAIERRVEKVLMDFLEVNGELSTLGLYEIGKLMAEYCVNKRYYPKVAVIGNPPTVTGFGAQVACNRNLVSMTFSERQLALNWLGATVPASSEDPAIKRLSKTTPS